MSNFHSFFLLWRKGWPDVIPSFIHASRYILLIYCQYILIYYSSPPFFIAFSILLFYVSILLYISLYLSLLLSGYSTLLTRLDITNGPLIFFNGMRLSVCNNEDSPTDFKFDIKLAQSR